jgi:hypothetical protein
MQVRRGRFSKSMTTPTQHIKAAYEALDKALGRLLDAGDENIEFLEEALSHRDEVLAAIETMRQGLFDIAYYPIPPNVDIYDWKKVRHRAMLALPQSPEQEEKP